MENKENTSERNNIRSEFDALPLDQKFAELFRMEAKAIEEALTYAIEQPFRMLEKVGDALSDFGDRVESKAKQAAENVKEKREVNKRTRSHNRPRSARPPKPSPSA